MTNKEIEEQTAAIAANIKYIEDNTGDYEELKEQTNWIVGNLKRIEENGTDLDEAELQADSIVANLKTIEEDETDLNEIEARLDQNHREAGASQKSRQQGLKISYCRPPPYELRLMLGTSNGPTARLLTHFEKSSANIYGCSNSA